jgi:hypothetical protein
MRQILIASDDASIYEAYPNINTGYDEILEIGKVPDPIIWGTTYASSSARSLINFDLSDSGSWDASSRYFLNLRIAHAKEVNKGQQLVVGHVSRSWVEGSGFFFQSPENREDGATWNQSTTLVSWSLAGGDLELSPTATYEVDSYPLEDIRIDVTDILQPIVSSSLPFRGLYIKYPDVDEVYGRNTGVIKVFSTQTHTIYQPTLEVVWNDGTFVTGSLTRLPSSNFYVAANVEAEYKKGTVQLIRFTAREQFPSRRFDSIRRYSNKYYIPSGSFYRIVDTSSKTVYGEFDAYNFINCDASGSYITLDTSHLYKNRNYTIELELNFSTTLKSIVEIPQTFTVI